MDVVIFVFNTNAYFSVFNSVVVCLDILKIFFDCHEKALTQKYCPNFSTKNVQCNFLDRHLGCIQVFL